VEVSSEAIWVRTGSRSKEDEEQDDNEEKEETCLNDFTVSEV
jgi:hypothetical protein